MSKKPTSVFSPPHRVSTLTADFSSSLWGQKRTNLFLVNKTCSWTPIPPPKIPYSVNSQRFQVGYCSICSYSTNHSAQLENISDPVILYCEDISLRYSCAQIHRSRFRLAVEAISFLDKIAVSVLDKMALNNFVSYSTPANAPNLSSNPERQESSDPETWRFPWSSGVTTDCKWPFPHAAARPSQRQL